MTLQVTENETVDVKGDAIPDEMWVVAVTVNSDGYIFRKVQDIAFQTEREAMIFHNKFGHIWTDLGFEILSVDFLKFARVLF